MISLQIEIAIRRQIEMSVRLLPYRVDCSRDVLLSMIIAGSLIMHACDECDGDIDNVHLNIIAYYLNGLAGMVG